MRQQQKWILFLVGCMLFLLLAAGCGNDTKTKAIFTADEYPIMDGSTANLPLMAEVMAQTCGITVEEAESLTTCTTTPNAWLRLAEGKADILLVYEPALATQEQLKEIGTELEVTPLGRDALVFINNADNPVADLSQQQLKDIYTGNITNWKQVGGKDIDIVPYQRDETSGSQSLFEKLLMEGKKPMEAPTELKPTEMGMLIDQLASYNNEANALGFSVFYYANYMYQQPGLKFVAVDGVKPSNETIANGSYPLLNEYYVAIRADEAENSPARILRDWILDSGGKAAMEKTGYIPMN